MLIEIPEDLKSVYPDNYMKGTDLTLWWITIILGLVISVLFLLKVGKVELKIQKRYFLSISFVIIFISITRSLYIVGVTSPKADYYNYIMLGYTMSMIGLTLFLLSLESIIIKKSKHIITIITFIGVILSLLGLFNILDRDFVRLSNVFISMFGLFTILIIHLIMVRKGIGEIRKKALILTLGLVMFILGFLGDSVIIFSTFPGLSLNVFPLIQIIGSIIMAFSGPLYVEAIFSLVHKGFRYF